VREISHPDRDELRLSDVLHALSDPVRLQIVRELAVRGEAACGVLGIRLAKSTLSHHFAVLRAAGVVRTRVVGTARVSTLRRDDLDACFPGLLDAVLSAREAA
jgi:DNA-binding transcriptional ArsR family regulator